LPVVIVVAFFLFHVRIETGEFRMKMWCNYRQKQIEIPSVLTVCECEQRRCILTIEPKCDEK